MFRFSGRGNGFAAIIERLVETPWLAYAFLLALVASYLFHILDHRKLLSPVPIVLIVCIVSVFLLRNTQGYGAGYIGIWVFGVIGCIAYWIEKLIYSQAEF